MELPPSGWYPDPYGMPALLRWWDGSAWTQHTHPDTTGGTGTGASGGGAAAASAQQTAQQSAVTQAGARRETVQPTTVQQAVGQPGTGQLSQMRPPTGPPTQPQPALPTTTVQQAVPATSVQQAVPATSVQHAVPTTTVQQAVPATTVQHAVQPTAYQAAVGAAPTTTVQPPALPGPGGADAGGTQVLFLGGDTWQQGAPSGPPPASRYGYRAARRRRRSWQLGALAGGTVIAVAVIAVIVASLAKSPTPTADQAPITHPAAAPTATAPTTPPPSASGSPTATAAASSAVLSDGQSGLSYTLLPQPWQPSCPSTLNNGAFTWTAGESAIAGQVNGGQTTWYGDACSGPLPQQYGYAGVASLESTAANLANTFQAAYYSALSHTVTPQVSQPVQVGGHPGWEITFLITYTNATAQGVSWADEQAAVVVADTGQGNAPAVFYTSIPASLGESNVAALVSSLQLSVTPQPGGSGSGGSPAPGSPAPGSPAPGGGNGNNP